MEVSAQSFEQYRSYLRLLASIQMSSQLRGKLDPSDIVQQTFLQAHQARGTFRGESEAELAGWLRKILIRTLLHAIRDYARAKRDVALERSLQEDVGRSSARWEEWLQGDQSTPSHCAQRNEQLRHLADAMEGLPEAQGEAVELYYWQKLTVSQIAEQMGRSPDAISGLLRRGLRQLREQLGDLEL